MTIADDWVAAAMGDDTLVVELLVRLQGATLPAPRKGTAALPLPLEWSVRQRRSRSLKKAQRASPSTPLTWSGATSFSGSGGGGYDEESCDVPPEKLLSAARSKINGECEKRSSKRLKRKKTLSELRVEESSLLKERIELKKEITKLRLHLEEQTAKNDKFKRMKTELQPVMAQESSSTALPCANSNKLQQKIPSAPDEPSPLSKFMLPDLNIPFEEESHCPELVPAVS